MAYELEENPIGTALGSIPDALFKALELKQSQQNQQQQTEMNKQTILAAKMQLKQQETALGMDRGGYGNEALNMYFQQLIMAPGALTPNASGILEWTGDPRYDVTSQSDAWQNYISFVGAGNINEADSRYFMNELWPAVLKAHTNKMGAELDRLTQANYSEKDIRKVLLNNPRLFKGLNTVMPYLDSKQRAQFNQYMPQAEPGFGQRMSSAAPYVGAVGGAGAAGIGWAKTTTSQKFIDEANRKYKKRLKTRGVNPEKRSTKTLNKLNQDLKKLNKSHPKTPKGWNTRADNLVDTKNKITKETSKINRILSKAEQIKAKNISDKSHWNRAMKKMPKTKLNFPVAAFAPTVLGGAGQIVGGSEGEALGRGVGGGVQATYGAAKGVSLAKYLMKVVPKIGAKKAAQAATIAMGDSPAPGPMDAAGLVWGLGSGGYEIYQAIQDWRLANQSFE